MDVFTEPTPVTPFPPLEADAFQRPSRESALTKRQEVLALARAKAKLRFLNAYEQCPEIAPACAKAKVGRRTIFTWKAEDEDFAAAMRECEVAQVEWARAELQRRAMEGVDTPVTVAGKREVVKKYSDALLLAHVKALDPQRYDRASTERGHTFINAPTTTNIQLERLSDDDLEALSRILGKAGPAGVIDVSRNSLENMALVHRLEPGDGG